MDAVRTNLLEETYERIINVGLCIVPYEDLSDNAAPELMFFGTTKDEKVFSFSELDAMFKSQYEQMDGFVNSLDRKRLFTRTSNDGKNAFITEEVTLTMTSPEEVNTIFMRCSCVMEYIDNQWKLTHLHASTPVETENDHWHMEEWKRENEKLQKLVDEQTADLHGKNRELKIEAALERIRAQATAMKESSDLLDIVVTMRSEFVNLGHEAHYFWHMRWLPDTYEKAMTSGDGTRIGMVMTLPRHIHGDIEPVAAWEKSKEPTYVLAMDVDTAVDYVDKMISLGDFEQVDPQAPSLDDIRHIGGLTFIMARTTHGEIGFSLPGVVPDPPIDAVDTLVRFAGVFDLAYKRFEDLKSAERQHREAQIELALERVRARTMAMQNSEELADVVSVLFDQIRTLGGNLWGTGFGLCEEDADNDEFWFANENGVFPAVSIPNTEDPAHKKMYEGWKNEMEFLALEGSGEDLKSHYNYMMTLPEVRPFFQKILDEGLSFPEWQQWNAAYFSHGYLLIITLEPYSNQEILKRFARVFDQTYTRFLDLQKAEAQARESKIQLALERVRARTMAMHNSEELGEVAAVMFEQISSLTSTPDRFNICIANKEDKSFDVFVTDQSGFKIKNTFNAKAKNSPVIAECFETWKNDAAHLIQDIHGKELENWIRYMGKVVGIPFKMENVKKHRFLSSVFFSHGFIGITTHSQPQETTINLIERFAKVFQQTYTRFLDLKKAETQARESEIQLALERVRARSMAMHQSDELADLSLELVKQVHALGIDTWFCAFNIYDDHPDGSIEWGSNGQGTFPRYRTPREGVFLDYYEAGQRGETLLINEIGEDECPAHYDYLCSLPGVGDQLLKMKDEGIPFPTSQIDHVAYFKYGYIIFITFEPAPEAYDIFKRFAKVFQQTYTRFLDLQKAEAQAREAKIEAALERVRARSMGMHKSDDLIDVVREIGMGIHELGIQLHYSQIYTDYTYDPKTGLNIWVDVEGQDYLEKFHIPYIDHTITLNFYNALNEGLDYFSDRYSKAEKDSFFKLLFKYSDLKRIPKKRKELILNASGWTRFTVILNEATLNFGRYSLDEFTEEEHEIFIRFAKVFGQAYTRFLDLKKAEEQAREAKIETSLEKVRSRTMGMQSSDELPEVANLLFLEVQSLGIPAWSCGYCILEEDSRSSICIMSSEGTLQKPFLLPHHGEVSFEEWDDFVQGDQTFFTQELGGEAIESHYGFMKSLPQLTPIFREIEEAGLSLPTYQINHLCKFAHGFLLFITYEPIPEAHDIFRRFTRVFDQTYTRFLDLKKAEAQAIEATKQASLDRVRGEIASMRSAEDLGIITPLIWNELTTLGIPFIRCGIFIIQEEDKHIEVYLSKPDGTSLAAMHLPFDSSELVTQTLNAWQQGSVYTQHWTREEFLEWGQSMMAQGQVPDLESYQGAEEAPKSLHLQFLPFNQGMLYVGSTNPLDEEEISLSESLAKAFSIAYARYEDFVKLERAKAGIEDALAELKATQSQLVQQEKLASLGQLTAGIAHEIKNPLNFVNNFSELSVELIEETREELSAVSNQLSAEDKKRVDEATEILNAIDMNLRKIHEHGSRADSIVKSMLEHSRGGSGKMEPTDLNTLLKEYVNLSFHGMRAGKDPINVDLQFEMDESITEVPLIAEDFSRVIINLSNNAFDAMREKLSKTNDDSYKPRLIVRTINNKQATFIEIQDNGPGIPKEIKDKILQPFFTTKKGTEGTGLGLSITNDIIKAHGGSLEVTTKQDEGTTFTIKLPTGG